MKFILQGKTKHLLFSIITSIYCILIYLSFDSVYSYLTSKLTPFSVILTLVGFIAISGIAAGFIKAREVGFSGPFYNKKQQKAVIEIELSIIGLLRALGLLIKIFVFSLCLFLVISFYSHLYIDLIKNSPQSISLNYTNRYYWGAVFAPFLVIIVLFIFFVFKLIGKQRINDMKQINRNEE